MYLVTSFSVSSRFSGVCRLFIFKNILLIDSAWVQHNQSWQGFLKYVLILVFVLVTVRSTFHYVQYYYGAIHWVAMSKEAFVDSFWRIRPSDKFQDLLCWPDYDAARKGIYKCEDKTGNDE